MGKKKILVVDDEPSLVEMLKMRLELNDFNVVTASDGQEGMLKAKSEKPDLILLDILMPNMDGYSFVREIKADESLRNTNVIVLTAKAGMKDLFAIEGIKHYVEKPFEYSDLLAKINSLLG
ncbi:MAG: response regulator [Candidatus Omnitrophica bacterium]|nr:response regulator [Candidatus Omnitrophota bacterium]